MNLFFTYLTFDFGVFLAILNVAASYIVCNTDFEIKAGKKHQLILIWLIPFLGPALAIYLNRGYWFEKERSKNLADHSDTTNT